MIELIVELMAFNFIRESVCVIYDFKFNVCSFKCRVYRVILEISEFKNLYDVHCEVFLDIIIIL